MGAAYTCRGHGGWDAAIDKRVTEGVCEHGCNRAGTRVKGTRPSETEPIKEGADSKNP